MKDKFEIYQESGVLEYWIVNPTEKMVQVYRRNETGKYIGLQPFIEGDLLETPIVSGLQINLGEVFDV